MAVYGLTKSLSKVPRARRLNRDGALVVVFGFSRPEDAQEFARCFGGECWPRRAAGRKHPVTPPVAAMKHKKNPRESVVKLAVALTVSAIFAVTGRAHAHHSFAMFDQAHPIEIAGTVVEFHYTNPHSYILIDVPEPEGDSAVWYLEGPAPGFLSRDGISLTTIQPGDQLVLTIDPLRTGAPGGSWSPIKTWWFKDGRPLVSR
jgi:hypothetical protein